MISRAFSTFAGLWSSGGVFGVAMTIGWVLLGLTLADARATTLYLSPEGDDANAGDSARQPLRTPTEAKDRLRELRDEGVAGPFEVVLGDGVYPLEQTLTFSADDGATAEEPVTWRAADGADPVLSGGTVLRGDWQAPEEGEVWTLELEEVAAGDWYFHQLWVNGRRATRARHPNEGYLYTAGPLPGFENPNEHRGNREASMGFRYREGDLREWDNFEDVNLFVYHAWTASLHWLDDLDTEGRQVHFVNPSVWPIGWWDREGQRYHAENFRAALDAPGEWYLDRQTGVLHYRPREGEDMARAKVVAPRLRQLVRVAGDGEAGRIVEGLRFQGLRFQHADWEIPGRGRPDTENDGWFVSADGQAANFATAAVHVSAARHVTFEHCEIAHVGEYGLWLAEGAQHCTVRQSHVHDLGAGAVRIGDADTPTDGWRAVEHNVLDNSFLHDGGNVFPAGCGVLLQRASHNEITHNEISDFYYTGISLGWSWGYAQSTARDNLVRYNHVHHIGWGVLSDMAGIYTLGVSPGTEITHNIFHHIRSHDYGGWGLYTDEGSSEILLANNLVYNTQTGGFHQHYGRDNVVRNNILAFSATHQLQRTRNEDHNSFDFERNIILFDNGDLLGGNWANDRFTMRRNLYHDISGEPLDFVGHSLEQWQARGHDEGSIAADPRFVRSDFSDRDARPLKPEHFELREDSPALQLGFQPLELDRVGLYGDPEWVDLPNTIELPRMTFERSERRRSIIDDFEDNPVGSAPSGGTVVGVGDGADITVSDATSAGGAKSLRFVEAPGLDESWYPHLFYSLDLRSGEAVSRFDLRIEEGAELFVEWRDAAQPYRAGPRIDIHDDGGLSASGKRALMRLPHDEWVGLEMRARLGAHSDGTYTLTVTLADGQQRHFEDLPLANPDFRRFQWFGLSGLAGDHAVFHLDNLEIRPAAEDE